jgi:hypothetical protein
MDSCVTSLSHCALHTHVHFDTASCGQTQDSVVALGTSYVKACIYIQFILMEPNKTLTVVCAVGSMRRPKSLAPGLTTRSSSSPLISCRTWHRKQPRCPAPPEHLLPPCADPPPSSPTRLTRRYQHHHHHHHNHPRTTGTPSCPCLSRTLNSRIMGLTYCPSFTGRQERRGEVQRRNSALGRNGGISTRRSALFLAALFQAAVLPP